jgi:ribose transport system substrate-binding protein
MNRIKCSALGLSLVIAAGTCFAAVSAEAKSSKDNIKVGLISFNHVSPVPHAMALAALDDCKTRGWTCELIDGKGDPVATASAGVNFVNRGFDAILNVVSDNNQLGPVIKAANAAHIPFVSMFSGDVSGITADIGASGVLQGALIGGELRSAIDLKGRVLYINWNVLPTLRERERGVRAAVADDKNITIQGLEVQVQGYLEDSHSKLLAAMRANKDVKAIVTGWTELAPGAIRAIEEAGLKDVKVYTFDSTEEGFDLMRKGSALVMLVGFGSKETADSAVQAIADTIDGNPPHYRQLNMRSCLFTKENLPAPGAEPDYKACTPFTAELRGQP